jgi:hypothetical protein
MEILFQDLTGRTEDNHEKSQDFWRSRRVSNQAPHSAELNVSLRHTILRFCRRKRNSAESSTVTRTSNTGGLPLIGYHRLILGFFWCCG